MPKKSADNKRFTSSKLLSLLALLDRNEIKKLNEFLSMPSQYNGQVLLNMLDALVAFHPDFDQPRLTAEYLFAKIFPGEPFKPQKLKKRMSDLVGQTYRFMAYLAIEEDPFLEQKLIAGYLSRRSFDALFRYASLQIKQLEAELERGADWFGHFYFLSDLLYTHPEYEKFTVKVMDASTATQAQDKMLVLEKMRYGLAAMDLGLFTRQKTEVPMFDAALQWLEEKTPDEAVFKLMKKGHQMLSDETEENFRALKTAFLENMQYIVRKERILFLQLLLNFSTRRFREQSDNLWIMETYRFLRFGIEHQLLIFNGKIREGTFSNVVNSAVLVKEFEYADTFISNYATLLDENIREHVVSLAKAFSAFHQGNFEAAYTDLIPMKFVSLRHRVVARPLIVRCLFEMQLTDEKMNGLFLSQLKSLEKFIRLNKSLNDSHKKPYIFFVQAMRAISAGLLEYPDDIQHWAKIKELLATEPVMAKQWLLDRLDKLKVERGLPL